MMSETRGLLGGILELEEGEVASLTRSINPQPHSRPHCRQKAKMSKTSKILMVLTSAATTPNGRPAGYYLPEAAHVSVLTLFPLPRSLTFGSRLI